MDRTKRKKGQIHNHSRDLNKFLLVINRTDKNISKDTQNLKNTMKKLNGM